MKRKRAVQADHGPLDFESLTVESAGIAYTIERDRFDDETKRALIVEAFRELVTLEANERARAADSASMRRGAHCSRYSELFDRYNGLGLVGATTRDRNRRRGRHGDDVRARVLAGIEHGQYPELVAAIVDRQMQAAQFGPADYASDGTPTEAGLRKLARVAFHVERYRVAQIFGLGSIDVRSVSDTWFLNWLPLDYADLGAILIANRWHLPVRPDGKLTDDDLGEALARARQSRTDEAENPAVIRARLIGVARKRWRELQAIRNRLLRRVSA